MPQKRRRRTRKRSEHERKANTAPNKCTRTRGIISEGRRLTDDKVLIITIVLVYGLTLRNLLIVIGKALC
jgi:hypothetical protein